MQVLDVGVYREAEDKQQRDRHKEHDGKCDPVAEQLYEFLYDKRAQPFIVHFDPSFAAASAPPVEVPVPIPEMRPSPSLSFIWDFTR